MSKICRSYPLSPIQKAALFAIILSAISACSFNPNIVIPESCNIRADTDRSALEYLHSSEFSGRRFRMAVIPFDVPETFAGQGGTVPHFGRELSRFFHQEIKAVGEIPIVELYDIDRWPGKRQEFFAGNYRAIEIGRNAGYDLILVGYLDDLVNGSDLSLYTKLIDTTNGITIWSGHSVVESTARAWRKELSRTRLIGDRPELFRFSERSAELARCTVKRIFSEEVVDDEEY